MKKGFLILASCAALALVVVLAVRGYVRLYPESHGAQSEESVFRQAEEAHSHPDEDHVLVPPVSGAESAMQDIEKKLTEADFVDLSMEVMDSLPLIGDFKGLTDKDVHLMPEILRNAGLEMGEISQVLHDQPELARQGLDFYRTCFENEEIPEQLRALCFANFRNLHTHIGNRELDWASMVPAKVLGLANQIPKGW